MYLDQCKLPKGWMRENKLWQAFGGGLLVVLLLVSGWSLQKEGRTVLSWGDRGSDVTNIQRDLKTADLYHGSVTGFYDRKTTAAVRKFQQQKKLSASGVADNQTRALLAALASRERKITEQNIRLLAALIESEAADEPYLGKVAVGAVVVNRMHSGIYPDTLEGVIFQSGAFQTVKNGQFGRPVSVDARRAAIDALNGEDPTGGCLFFWNPAKSNSPWSWQQREVTKIGRHIFAK